MFRSFNEDFFVSFKIDYFNNATICELIEQNHKGILSIMDEGCRNIGKVSDEVCKIVLRM